MKHQLTSYITVILIFTYCANRERMVYLKCSKQETKLKDGNYYEKQRRNHYCDNKLNGQT